jgi:DNA-binding IclR family transcriptional regulator
MGDRRDPTIQSVDRAARILKALAAGSPRLGVSELAERLGLAKTTVHGLLRTLERQDLVEQDPETGKYRLGPEMLQLGNAFLDHHELRGRSLVWADTLAERVGEAVRVGVLYGRRVLVVHHVFRPDDSVQILEVGASVPWHASALGKPPSCPRTAGERWYRVRCNGSPEGRSSTRTHWHWPSKRSRRPASPPRRMRP